MSSLQSQAPESLFLVDDDPAVREAVGAWLSRSGYRVEAFADGESCLEGLARTSPHALCLDLIMPGMGGVETLRRIKASHRFLPVIILTIKKDVESVVEAMQLGAYDYLAKPIEPGKLLTTIRNAVERYELSARVAQLEREAGGRGYPGLIGTSPAMQALFRQMDQLTASDISVFIRGESGTGKELVARAIHERGGRHAGPFVALNCAAIPETLQESELFGHEKGSFTGAAGRYAGKFEQAHGGTLFLDEVAELSPTLQAKLLRVLQGRRFQRVGGSQEIEADFRLLAASHRDLAAEVRAGRFREDLYFRIVVFELRIPPLRERRQDIAVLAQYFLAQLCQGPEKGVPPLASDALVCLAAHPWPGNVRELRNVIERALVASRGGPIGLAELPPSLTDSITKKMPSPAQGREGGKPPLDGKSPPMSLAELERWAIESAIGRHGGNLTRAVRELGIGRTTLYRKLRQYNLR